MSRMTSPAYPIWRMIIASIAQPSAFQAEPVCNPTQIATVNDVANMPTRNCGKYIAITLDP